MTYRNIRVGIAAALFLSPGALMFSPNVGIDDGRIQAQPCSPQPESRLAAGAGRSAAQGKELFVARCAGCHNENGDKPLPDGPPLNRRVIPPDRLFKSVSSRLAGASDDEKRAVVAYVKSFMKGGRGE